MRFLGFLLLPLAVWASDEKWTWDLSQLYKTDAAWNEDFKEISSMGRQLAKCRGHLKATDIQMKPCLDLFFKTEMKLSRLYAYASLYSSADQRSSKYSEMLQKFEDARSQFGQTTAFFFTELSKMKRSDLNLFLKKPGADIYAQYLRSILDQAEHILDTKTEELISRLNPLFGESSLYGTLLNSDIPWPSVQTHDHKTIKVNRNGYELLRESLNRDDRKKAFAAYGETALQYQRTVGEMLSKTVRGNVIFAKLRHYKNALDAALEDEKIPPAVYKTLIAQVNEGLPVYHKFFQHEAKAMRLKDYSYEDVFATAETLQPRFTLNEGQELILKALAPLGANYTNRLSKAWSERWMDALPRDGKDTGGFMAPFAYEVHPFVLLNYRGDFESVSTLAHEWGHAMNSVYTNQTQAYVNSNNPTFLSEIASTFNEVLLREYLIRTSPSKAEKRYYLETLLQLIRQTFFVQSQYAEFELAVHEATERGESLAAESMTKLYGDIARKYYGVDQGIMKMDPKNYAYWVMIPHFYSSFYVYNYATCISAALYFAEKILTNEPGALENYIRLLSSGSKKYPYEILKDSGVDMARPEVYRATVHRMDQALEEIAKLTD